MSLIIILFIVMLVIFSILWGNRRRCSNFFRLSNCNINNMGQSYFFSKNLKSNDLSHDCSL